MRKIPVTIDRNSTYHSILVKKYGRKQALQILQEHQDIQYIFTDDFMEAIRAYGTHKRVKVKGWA